jgi:hypothetical protein
MVLAGRQRQVGGAGGLAGGAIVEADGADRGQGVRPPLEALMLLQERLGATAGHAALDFCLGTAIERPAQFM